MKDLCGCGDCEICEGLWYEDDGGYYLWDDEWCSHVEYDECTQEEDED